jgi:NAD(P)-dependent dehydrogenase (short-subunit alcohol dehydrogenase family)
MKIRLKPVKEQAVVVFGASSGMGRETALHFAKAGARLVLASRNTAALESLADEIRAQGGTAAVMTADVTDFEQVKAVGEKAIKEFGRLDTWAHFAATPLYAEFTETKPEEFKRVIEVNLLGAAYAAMVAIPWLMEAGGGALIQVSSVEAEVGLPFQSSYAASKHGMKGYLDVLRMELRNRKAPISVTNVMPTGINTPFFNHARTKLGVKPSPPPPIYQPAIVARAIVHCSSHATDEVVIGGGGGFFVWSKRLAPHWTDALARRLGYSRQFTGEKKQPSAPSNLEGPVTDTRVQGDFSQKSFDRSLYTWFQLHPRVKQALGLGLFTAAISIVTQRILERKA